MGIRKGLYTTQEFPFPRKLMNTALSPELVPTTQAIDLLNFIPSQSKAGSGEKRFGTTQLGTEITGETIQRLASFTKSDGTLQLLAYTDSGKIYSSDDDGTTWVSRKTGLNILGLGRFVDFNEKLIIYNGKDTPMSWDGSTISDLSEYVKDNLFPEWVSENSISIETISDNTVNYPANRNIKIEFSGDKLAISSLTQTTGTATATTTNNHNLSTGDIVTISNATPEGYNGDYEIVSTGANTFTFSVDSGLASPASFQTDYIECVKGTTKEVGGFVKEHEDLVITSTGVDTPDKTTAFKFKVFLGENSNLRNAEIQYTAKLSEEASRAYFRQYSYKVQYKASNGSAWKTLNSGSVTDTSKPLTITANNLPRNSYNIRVISEVLVGASVFSGKATITDVEVKVPTKTEILTNGTPNSDKAINIASITLLSGTATVTTTTDHGYATNDAVTIYNAEQDEYNGTYLITVTGATTFTYGVGGNPTSPATVDTNLPSTIVYSFQRLVNTTTVTSSSYTSPNTTVTLTDNILPNESGVTIDRLWYEDNPPAFSYIISHNNRLWALGAGETLPSTYKSEDRLKLYFTDSTNNENTWFNEETQAPSFIDVTNKHGVEDELIGLSTIEGNLILHGRNKLQVWTGYSPIIGGDFSHFKTIPVGTFSGDLIQDFPSDIMFATKYGLRSLRNVFQSEGLEVSPDLGSDIDPSIQDAISSVTTTANYKALRSFRYERDGMYGYFINGEMWVYIISEEAKGWVRFDGAFSSATDFLSLPDGRLIMSEGGFIYTYDNGAGSTTKSYTDRGSAIQLKWATPWVEKYKRWANKKWNLVVGVNTKPTTVTLRRHKDGNIAQESAMSISIGNNIALWDSALWDVSLWDTGTTRPVKRDKFIAESFSFSITETGTAGAVNIISIQAIGS